MIELDGTYAIWQASAEGFATDGSNIANYAIGHSFF